ncbi:MAG: Hemerythrin domain protein [uncultured Nocardioidaceae bacterium]|uniref:Hemerythrin domain protein n=1 Tax=uncultured Nocardioidaceae bacterium TaxID=253824 RepID=A0A6J4NIH5_9ACTN|nr:MAG: Hemerythrin domain protein [uncultured Nocardioidaceae bacterium]
MTDQDKDVVDILSEDHREVEEMFRELESLGVSDPAVQARGRLLVDQVTIALVRHAVAEEVVVYPAVKERVSEEEAERAKREHAEAEESMKALERLDPEDPSFDQEIRKLMTEIRTHVAEEEGEMFPHMREVMSREELVKLGGQVEAIKAMAPTRPHPSVPNEPGPRLAAGPVAGLFDRLRDLASGRGKEG